MKSCTHYNSYKTKKETKKANDDLRVYVSSGDASTRTSMLLSSANLLRVYGDGIGLDNNSLPNNNWVYKKMIDGYYYRATTHGYVNDNSIDSEGVDFVFYMPYEALGMEADVVVAEYGEIFNVTAVEDEIKVSYKK